MLVRSQNICHIPLMSRELEEGLVETLDFGKLGNIASKGLHVIPVVVQNADTGAVLTLAYANREALERTLRDRVAVFWSTSRNELWIKGATSCDALGIVDVRINCEQNSLLYLVRPKNGGVCHTKGLDGKTRATCYYRRVNADGSLGFIEKQA
jgi:phosphoribosyl-AMP cyclohydrolase